MNPFMMFLNTMGMRCMSCLPFSMGMNFMMPSLFCGSNFMTMPYRQDDNLWFFNSPIYRNTSYDYLLDPRLAIQSVQRNMQNGGYGTTFLPGFNFPAIGGGVGGGINLPGTASTVLPSQKTPEQQEAENKKAEEAKKPAAQKAKKLNAIYNQFKKLAEESSNGFPEIPEELDTKAKEAMEKETADEQLAAMKEVISAIPANVLRKTILADNNIKEQLRRAGYNFNLAQNQYSLKNSDIKPNDIDHADRIRQLHSDIQEKNYNELQVLAGQLIDTNTAKTRILGVISSWNDKYKGNERGILRFIGANLPTGDDAIAKTEIVKNAVKTITEALLVKADEYEGYPKITKAREDVATKLDSVISTNGFTKSNIDNLANACDTLYARLRMQEAVKINTSIRKNHGEINEIKEGVITNNIVIEETQKDLKEEGFNNIPALTDLDPEPERDVIVLNDNNNNRNEDADADEEYADDKQALVDEYLVGEKGYLSKVEGQDNIYQTADVNGKGIRYFTVNDNKLVEVTKKGDKFETPENPKEVTAVDVGKQNASIEKAKRLIDEKVIKEYNISGFNKYPVFKATGAPQFFVIIDGEFGKVKPSAKKGENVNLTKLTINDIDTSYDESEIKSEAKVKAEEEQAKIDKENQEHKDVTDVESMNFTSLSYARSKDGRYEIEKVLTGSEPENLTKCIVKPLNVEGYFLVSKPKKRYYKYDDVNNKLVYQKGVVNISDDGYMKIETEKNGKKEYSLVECAESITNDLSQVTDLNETIQNYSKQFADSICSSDSITETSNTCRKLNTLIAMNDTNFTVNFIKGYQDNKGWWSNSFCEEISRESGIKEGKNADDINSKRRYLAKIASLMINVFNETSFDQSEFKQSDLDKMYITLEKIAKGELMTVEYIDSFSGKCTFKEDLIQTAKDLDKIVKNIMKSQPKES